MALSSILEAHGQEHVSDLVKDLDITTGVFLKGITWDESCKEAIAISVGVRMPLREFVVEASHCKDNALMAWTATTMARCSARRHR